MEGQGPSIALAPDVVFEIAGFSVRNAHLTFTLISACVVLLLVLAVSRFQVRPSKFQMVIEGIYTFFSSKIDGTNLDPWKRKILLSIVLTLFLLIIICNVFTVAPILSSIVATTGIGADVPLFRSPTSHFSLPIALGLFVVLLANFTAIVIAPVRYVGNFIKIGPLLKARSP